MYHWLLTCLFALIRSALIDPATCPWVCTKLFVGNIQTVHMDLLPPHVCGRSWWGCRLGVQTCSHQFISLLGLKYPSSYFLKPSFVDCWLVFIEFTVLAFIYPETCPQVWWQLFCGPYQNRKYRFAYPIGLWKVVARELALWFQLLSSIYWMYSSKSYQVFLMIIVSFSFSSRIRMTRRTLHKNLFINITGNT